MKKPNVLYVDDEVLNLLGFDVAFKRQLNILTAASGKEALDIFEKESIDIVVSDYKMPIMTGVELLKIIKEKNAAVHRFIITGFIDNLEVLKAQEDGTVEELIQKPYDFDLFLEKLLSFSA